MQKRWRLVFLVVVLACIFAAVPAWATEAVDTEAVNEITRTPQDLSTVLDALKESPWVDLYILNVFDCSNMSVLLCCLLQMCGFEANILEGVTYAHPLTDITKQEPLSRHVVVKVWTYTTSDDDEIVKNVWIVEPTNLTTHANYLIADSVLFVPLVTYNDEIEARAANRQEYWIPKFFMNIVFDNMPSESLALLRRMCEEVLASTEENLSQ